MSKVQINIRAESWLKERLQKIAAKEDATLSDIAVRALESYLKTNIYSKTNNSEGEGLYSLPSAEEMQNELISFKEIISQMYRDFVVEKLHNMVESANSSTIIRFETFSDVNRNLHTQTVMRIVEDLKKLGYSVHYFQSSAPNVIASIDPILKFSEGDIAIALTPEDISFYKELEKK